MSAAAFSSRTETERVKAAIAAALAKHGTELTLGSDWAAGRAAVYINAFFYGNHCYTCAVQMLRGPAFDIVLYESSLMCDFQRVRIKNADSVDTVIDAYLERIR